MEDGCFERGLQNRDPIFLRQNTVIDTGESADNAGDMTKKAEKTWLSFQKGEEEKKARDKGGLQPTPTKGRGQWRKGLRAREKAGVARSSRERKREGFANKILQFFFIEP